MKLGFGLVTLALATAAIPATAFADLRVCNYSGVPTWISVVDKQADDYVSRGWFEVGAGGECRTVVSGDLRRRHYYVYGYDKEGSEVAGDGDDRFCTISGRNFNLLGANRNCSGPGREWKSFVKVDVGDRADFDFELYDW